jgi:hypothetical protein
LRRGDGYGTACEGRLKLTRRLSEGELAWVEEVLATGCWGAGRWAAGRWKDDESDTEAALTQEAEAKNDARCGGPRIFHVPDHADFRAQRRGFIVRAGMDAHKAGDLRITDGGRGLEYCSDKSYRMVNSDCSIGLPAGAHSAGAAVFTPNHTLGLPPCRGTGHPLHPAPWLAPVAQLDRVLDYGSRGWEFESLRARQSQSGQSGERRTVWLPCHCEGRSDAASTIKVPTWPAIASLDSR